MSDWKKCSMHGDIDGDHQWGCPDCVAELRKENAELRANPEGFWGRSAARLQLRVNELEAQLKNLVTDLER